MATNNAAGDAVGNKVLRLTPGQLVALDSAGLHVEVKLLDIEPGTQRARVLFIAPKSMTIQPPRSEPTRSTRHDVGTPTRRRSRRSA